jgi:hypothetical protein
VAAARLEMVGLVMAMAVATAVAAAAKAMAATAMAGRTDNNQLKETAEEMMVAAVAVAMETATGYLLKGHLD